MENRIKQLETRKIVQLLILIEEATIYMYICAIDTPQNKLYVTNIFYHTTKQDKNTTAYKSLF